MIDILEAQEGLRLTAADIAETGRWLKELGALEGTAGNIVVRRDDIPRITQEGSVFVAYDTGGTFEALQTFVATATTRRIWDIRKRRLWENLCVIQMHPEEQGYWLIRPQGSDKRPTSEFGSHVRAHLCWVRRGQPKWATVHAQPRFTTLLSRRANTAAFIKSLYEGQPEMIVFIPEGIGFVPRIVPGSPAMENATLAQMESGYRFVVWQNHGVFVAGDDLLQAYNMIDFVEAAAWSQYHARCFPEDLPGWTDQQLREIAHHFKVSTTLV